MGLRNTIAKKVISWATESRSTGILQAFNVGKYLPSYKDWNTKNAVKEGYQNHTIVYKAVSKISTAAASVDWVTVDGEGELVENNPATDLIETPSEKHSWNDIIQSVSGFKSLAGDAFLLYLRSGDQQELVPLFPGYVKAKTDDKGRITKYQYGTGENKATYDPEQIIHFQFQSFMPGWEGYPPLKSAGRIVDLDNEAVDWHKATLERGGRPSGALKAKGELSKKQRKQIKKRRDEMQDPSTDEAHIPIFGADLDWLEFSKSAKELDFMDSREANKAEIADAFDVPVDLFNFRDSKYKNQQTARTIFWGDTVVPRLEELKSTFNSQLAPQYEEEVYLDYRLTGTPAVVGPRLERAEEAVNYWDMDVPFAEINDKLGLGFATDNIPTADMTKSEIQPKQTREKPQTREIPQNISVQTRARNPETEEEKTEYWRSIDQQKTGFMGAVANKVTQRFNEEQAKVIKAYENNVDYRMAIQQERENWNTLLKSSKKAVIEKFGPQTWESLHERSIRQDYNPWNAQVQAQVEEQTGQSVESIISTTQTEVEQTIVTAQSQGMGKEEITKELAKTYGKFKDYRSSFIARTEVHSASSLARHDAATKSKVVKKKKWISSRDARVRESHRDMDGETQPMKQAYSNGLMYPGDQSGPIEQVVNCRCAESYITQE